MVGMKAPTVPDILIAILDDATAPTLASAARVSRAWSIIALDKLWSSHDIKVMDLLRVLPLSHEEDLSPPHRFWSFQRSPTNDEWARFYFYASRVRSLFMPSSEPDRFEPRIIDWKIKNDLLFPNLRKVEWHSTRAPAMPFSQLRAFITSSLQQLFLGTEYGDDGVDEDALSFLDSLTTTESLRLKKFKLYNSLPIADPKLAMAIAKLVVANEDSISALELRSLRLDMSFLANHSLQNLRALCFGVKHSTGNGEAQQPIQALVDGCPHVEYLRIWFERHQIGTDLLAYSGVRAILAWQLLSFEVEKGTKLSLATLGEMAEAWPKLRSLNVHFWRTEAGQIHYPLPRLAEIVLGFPELEELDMAFHCYGPERDVILADQRVSERCQPPRLKKLKLEDSILPGSPSEYELMAQFLARVCSPGLRIERMYRAKRTGGSVPLAETEKLVTMGRDPNPDWDAVFQKVEELHGGVRIWVGHIPEDSDGVWF
ncbi:hypothetical protein FRC01_005520 [Tulasnella sp. 417]|nr:hypothetical protein FRC01_005520 [Tulasnella sp. 417]